MWTQIINAIIGFWLVISTAFIPMNEHAADNNAIVGPLVMTFAVVALWEINRNVAKANVVVVAWLVLSMFILNYESTAAIVSNSVSALVIVILSLIPRKPGNQYGGGWSSLFESNPPHLQAGKKH